METTKPVPNTFETVLRNQRKGLMAIELSEKLAELTRACTQHCKSGKLILTITLTPASGDGSTMSVEDQIALKLPETKKPNSLFFTTDDGQLVRDNPEQHQLNLKVVNPETAAIAAL